MTSEGNSVELASAEQAAVAKFLRDKDSMVTVLSSLAPYLLPVVLLGFYGLYSKEYLACGLSFLALLGLSLWYLRFLLGYFAVIKSALAKYEAEVKALQDGEGRR